MAMRLVLAEAPDTNRQEKRDSGQKLDYLQALPLFHFCAIMPREHGEGYFAMTILVNQIRVRGQKGNP